MSENHVIVRSHGKTYFGEKSRVSSDGTLVLKNVVEILTMIMPTPNGFQKRTTITGLDYCDAPTKEVRLKDLSLAYDLNIMHPKDAEMLTKDYESFVNKDNLVQAPPKKNLVTP